MEDSRKRSHCFAITINHVNFDKTCLGQYWIAAGLLHRFLCAEEHHKLALDPVTGEVQDGDPGVHHHIFADFIDGYFLSEVQEMLYEFLDGDRTWSIHTSVCKSPKSYFIYITKEDYFPFIFNVGIDDLSLYARCWHHAKTEYRYIKPINKAHAFIVRLGNNARFAIEVIEQHLNNLRMQAANDRRVYEPNRRCFAVNEILSSVQHLYIEGPPGYGKTEVVDYMLKGRSYWKAGDPSSFLFGTLSEKYDVIWFEDFDLEKFKSHLSTLLSLMDHKEVTISQKGKDDRTIIFKGQIIYTSNFPIGHYDMFRRRVKEIYTQHKLFECLGCVVDYVPANEIPSTTDFELSGQQLLDDLDNEIAMDGLNNIMDQDEIRRFFDSM